MYWPHFIKAWDHWSPCFENVKDLRTSQTLACDTHFASYEGKLHKKMDHLDLLKLHWIR